MDVSQATASRAERSLLIHRLRDAAETHERLAEKDGYADTADTLTTALEREPALCGSLLRDAIQALEGRTTEAAAEQALASYSDDVLKAELARRDATANAAYWERRKREAAYLCPDCGGPDSCHTLDCPSDTDCT